VDDDDLGLLRFFGGEETIVFEELFDLLGIVLIDLAAEYVHEISG
jgi:hypothetical protein